MRPDFRVRVGSGSLSRYPKPLSHDDVVMVPEFCCKEDDWSMYYELVEEMRELQAAGVRESEWISWHEGAHLISKNPKGSKVFQSILQRMCDYFDIEPSSSVRSLPTS